MKFTIITAVFNGEEYLTETIESVINQTYRNIEYIIIDGGSTDGTINLIKKYEHHLSHWQSEKDESMYEAINKGLKLATGDYVLCLNSDDQLFSSNTILEVFLYMQKNQGFFAYYGDIVKIKGNQKKSKKTFQCSHNNLLYSQHCSFVPHPTLFINKIIAQNYQYNTFFRYASDYDYILNLTKFVSLKYMPINITLFREHPKSITSSGKITSERIEILRINSLFSKSYIVRQFYYLKIWVFYKVVQTLHA